MHEKTHVFPIDSNNTSFFQVLTTGVSYCDGSYKRKRKNAKGTIFEYILKGEGTLKINNLIFYPKAGDIYLLPKGSDHIYYSDKKNPWTKIWITTVGNLVPQFLSVYKLEKTFFIEKCPLKHLFERVLSIGKNKKNDIEIIQNKLVLIIYEIILKIAYYKKKNEMPFSEDILKVKNYLDSHVEEKLSLKKISSIIFKSSNQTIITFKKEIGITPYDYFLKKKVEHAKFLLLNTDFSVKEIAYRLNFSNEYHFSNIFKQKVNISPSYYRKQTVHHQLTI
jgi:AraC-like DNA-binding protein